MRSSFLVGLLAILLTCAAHSSWAAPQTSAFTYQGQLKQNGEAFTGVVDLQFQLWDSQTAGNPVGAPVSHDDVPVQEGIFTVELDFGNAFGPEQKWIQVIADGTPLLPRQAVTAAPVAAFALSGVEGPMGPAGAQGPQGPAGPAGTTGQSANTVYSTGLLTLTQYTTSYTLIPGMTQTVTVPSGAKVFIAANGAFQNVSAGSVYAAGDVAIYIDGAPAMQRRIIASNTPALGAFMTQWALSGVFPLSAGSHTIQVRARDAGGTADGNLGGSDELIKANLSVLVINQ
jgi:hypothetical protein